MKWITIAPAMAADVTRSIGGKERINSRRDLIPLFFHTAHENTQSEGATDWVFFVELIRQVSAVICFHY